MSAIESNRKNASRIQGGGLALRLGERCAPNLQEALPLPIPMQSGKGRGQGIGSSIMSPRLL